MISEYDSKNFNKLTANSTQKYKLEAKPQIKQQINAKKEEIILK